MSCSLYYKKVVEKGNRVGGIQLRDILEKKYRYPSRLDYSDIPYFEALMDANVDGAAEMIEAITKYDVIEIYLEC